MKKFFLPITLSLLLALSACGTQQTPSATTANTQTEATAVATVTDETNSTAPESGEPTLSDLIAEYKQNMKLDGDMFYTQEDVCDEPALSSYKKFASCSEESITVPGLNQSIVPQGMDYWKEMGWMLISGYASDENKNGGKGSALFAVDMESGRFVGEYFLKNMDGTYHTSHAGGVAVTKKNVFISNGSTLYRIPLTELLKQSGDATIVEEISVPVSASFANCSGGILWVGDFQYGDSYPTAEFRHMKNRQGGTYFAWTVGYILDGTTENELKASAMVKDSFATPDYVLSHTERIQGMSYLPEIGQIALSQSYGRTNTSTIMFYEDPMGDTPHATTMLNGVSVPVWFLDKKLDNKQLLALPMSEGIANIDGKLYVLFESGAEKYRLGGGKHPTDKVYVVDFTKW